MRSLNQRATNISENFTTVSNFTVSAKNGQLYQWSVCGSNCWTRGLLLVQVYKEFLDVLKEEIAT